MVQFLATRSSVWALTRCVGMLAQIPSPGSCEKHVKAFRLGQDEAGAVPSRSMYVVNTLEGRSGERSRLPSGDKVSRAAYPSAPAMNNSVTRVRNLKYIVVPYSRPPEKKKLTTFRGSLPPKVVSLFFLGGAAQHCTRPSR